MKDIEPQLCDLLREALGQTFADLTPSTDLIDELALESIQVMDFIAEVEDHFDIMIEVDRLAAIRNINELAEVVRESLA